MNALLIALALGQFIGPLGGVDATPFRKRVAFKFSAPTAGDYPTLTATTGQTITCARASTATVQTSPSAVAAVASGHCAVDYRGLQVEGAATNVLLRSADLSNAAWSNDGVTVVANQAVAPDGTTTMAKITYVSGGGGMYQQASWTSSTGPFSTSAWFRQVDASNKRGFIRSFCSAGSAATCTCARQDGSACTPTISSGTCSAWSDFASIDRLQIDWTCTVAIATSSTQEFGAGIYSSGTGSIYAWGAQAEQGVPFATSYIPTTGTSATRAEDGVSFAKPAGLTMQGATVWSEGATVNLEGLNASGGAQQYALYTNVGGNPGLYVFYNAATAHSYGTSDSVSSSIADTDSAKVGAAVRYLIRKSAGTITTCSFGVCGTPAAVGAAGTEPTTMCLGTCGVGGEPDGWISSACLDSKSTGCAP